MNPPPPSQAASNAFYPNRLVYFAHLESETPSATRQELLFLKVAGDHLPLLFWFVRVS